MRKRTWLGCVLTLAALSLSLSVFPVGAETLDQKYEYARRIKTAQTVGTLGSGLFGDQTNPLNGMPLPDRPFAQEFDQQEAEMEGARA